MKLNEINLDGIFRIMLLIHVKNTKKCLKIYVK